MRRVFTVPANRHQSSSIGAEQHTTKKKRGLGGGVRLGVNSIKMKVARTQDQRDLGKGKKKGSPRED